MDLSSKHEDFCLRRRVPAFGSWDFNDTEYLSYTQCFETARPGKMLRNSFSEHRDPCNANEVFAPSGRIRRRPCSSCECKINIMSLEPQVIKNEKWLVGEAIRNDNKNSEMKVNSRLRPRPRLRPMPVISVSETKAIDEDLYTISPELLRAHNTKRTKVWGIFSSCINPKCSP